MRNFEIFTFLKFLKFLRGRSAPPTEATGQIISEEDYNALETKNENTLYIVQGADGVRFFFGDKEVNTGAENVVVMTLSQYNALKIHDENTLYVVTVNGGTAVYKEAPAGRNDFYQENPPTAAELFSAPERAGFDLLLGEKSVDLSMGGVQFHTYKTEDYTFSWFHDSWAMPTEEEYEQLMKDGMIPENWPFASLEEELEARSKVRLDGFGCGVSGAYADSTMTMKITNSPSERFTITFDPQVKKYSEDARSIGITLPRALEKTDALIIDGVKKKAYIEAENGKKTYVSDAVNWDEWKTLLGTTNVFCDEGEGDITVSVRKALVRDSSGRINDWGFVALYLE